MGGSMSSSQDQLQALRSRAGWCRAADTGWIAVTGADRVRWLNGMVTNSVQALTPGDGAYTFLLSAQGRIQGDAVLWAERDRILLETAASQVPHLVELLDRFVIMDDVELSDISSSMHGILLAGPAALEALKSIGIHANPSRLLKRMPVEWNSRTLQLQHGYSPLVPRLELWCGDADTLQELADRLATLPEDEIVQVSAEAMEQLRIVQGTPEYGADIREQHLPQETAQTRALHFAKGCYLGQEIVERIRSRGNVHRTFAQFAAADARPAPGSAIESEGKPVGEITSVTSEPVDGRFLALGFIRREALERGLPLTYNDEGRSVPLEPLGQAVASKS